MKTFSLSLLFILHSLLIFSLLLLTLLFYNLFSTSTILQSFHSPFCYHYFILLFLYNFIAFSSLPHSIPTLIHSVDSIHSIAFHSLHSLCLSSFSHSTLFSHSYVDRSLLVVHCYSVGIHIHSYFSFSLLCSLCISLSFYYYFSCILFHFTTFCWYSLYSHLVFSLYILSLYPLLLAIVVLHFHSFVPPSLSLSLSILSFSLSLTPFLRTLSPLILFFFLTFPFTFHSFHLHSIPFSFHSFRYIPVHSIPFHSQCDSILCISFSILTLCAILCIL